MVPLLIFLLMVHASQSDTQTESCKDILWGFLSGHSSSAGGHSHIRALKEDFKRFTNAMEQSFNALKEKVKADIEKKGI
jgi:hypothetical protein